MQRLTGLDATFLYMETPTSPMHVASLIVFDPSDLPGGFSFEKVMSMYRGAAAPRAAVPAAGSSRSPSPLHHPLWIEDPDFDLDCHVRHIAVPSPGGTDELAELVGHLVRHPARPHPPAVGGVAHRGPRGRPRRRAHQGPPRRHRRRLGRRAHRRHVRPHARGASEIPPPDDEWEPDKVPNDTELVGYAASVAGPPAAARRQGGPAHHRGRAQHPPRATASPTSPRRPRRSPRRARRSTSRSPRTARSRTATLSLADVKKVKNAFGTTVNDVVLALCAGALRHYFDAQGEQLDGPLVAMVPVSVRTDDQQGAMGNQVSSMLTSLATDIDDPVERLQAIHEGMRRRQGAAERHRRRHAAGLGRVRRPGRRRPRRPPLLAHADRRPPPAAVQRHHLQRARPAVPALHRPAPRLMATYPIGPIFDGGGLNMTVMSYLDSIDFGLLACPDVLPDLGGAEPGAGRRAHRAREVRRRLTVAPRRGDQGGRHEGSSRRGAVPGARPLLRDRAPSCSSPTTSATATRSATARCRPALEHKARIAVANCPERAITIEEAD